MMNENIKVLRKNKGLTQDVLASKLNVVRQTVSKWEKGLSVPDAEMLQRLAEIFETDVSCLLGKPIEQNENMDMIAEQLSRINDQLVIKNRRSKRVWKTIGIIALIMVVVQILIVIAFEQFKFESESYTEVFTEEIIGE